MWSIHAVEYYSAVKRNIVLIRPTAWMILENIMPSTSQAQKDKYYSPYMKYLG